MGVDLASLRAKLPLPSAGDLQLAGEAIETVQSALEGNLSLESVQQIIGSELGKAAGALVAGTAIGTVVPGLGNLVGLAVGVIVGQVMSALFGADDRRQREQAIYSARDKTIQAVTLWEYDAGENAWKALAQVSNNDGDKDAHSAVEDRIAAIVQHFDRHEQTAADVAEVQSYITRAAAMLRAWGFRPEGVKTGFGKYTGSPYSFAAAEAKWEKPFRNDPPPGAAGSYGRPGKGAYAGTIRWSNQPPTTEERFAAWRRVIDRRLELEKKILLRWQAYILELAALRLAIVKAFATFRLVRRFGIRLGGTTGGSAGGSGLAARLPPLTSGRPAGGGFPLVVQPKRSAIPWVLGGLVVVGLATAGYVYRRPLARWARRRVPFLRRR